MQASQQPYRSSAGLQKCRGPSGSAAGRAALQALHICNERLVPMVGGSRIFPGGLVCFLARPLMRDGRSPIWVCQYRRGVIDLSSLRVC